MKSICFLFYLSVIFSCSSNKNNTIDESKIINFVANTDSIKLKFYWKDDSSKCFRKLSNLKKQIESEGKELLFAMNGGMYNTNLSPKGLYIENSFEITPIDTAKTGYGNFYIQPNGVFYISKAGNAGVCTTYGFKAIKNVQYATQSGPMMLIDGEVNSKFNEKSRNLNIRNGVGILPDGNVLLAISKKEISFYDFATFFKQKGCKNALYLDGFVSQAYYQKKSWIKNKSDLGVFIAAVQNHE